MQRKEILSTGNYSPSSLQGWREISVSPSLAGNLYEITCAIDPKGNAWAIKTLKPQATTKYPGLTPAQIFNIHQQEHLLFVKHLDQFVSATVFFTEENNKETNYKICQPWVQFGVQYKEALKNGRILAPGQYPPLADRSDFIQKMTSLFKDPVVYPKVADIDFFIADNQIILIDTNFLWHPKLANDTRCIAHNLSNFLFTPDELKEDSVKKTITEFENAMHFNQID